MPAHAVKTPKQEPTPHCVFCDNPVLARGMCRAHYAKAGRLKLAPEQLEQLAGVAKKPRKNRSVSPRLTDADIEKLEKAVQKGRAKSVYLLAGKIIHEWVDSDSK